MIKPLRLLAIPLPAALPTLAVAAALNFLQTLSSEQRDKTGIQLNRGARP